MKQSYSTKYMIVHLGKDVWGDTVAENELKEKYKEFPYQIMTHGHNHVAPPLSRQELMGLADFIYNFLRETGNEI